MLQQELEALKEEVKVLEEGLNGEANTSLHSVEKNSMQVDESEEKLKRREATVNGGITNGLVNGTGGGIGRTDEVEELKKEIEGLKKKLGEMEVKAARKTHDVSFFLFSFSSGFCSWFLSSLSCVEHVLTMPLSYCLAQQGDQ